ncbi:MAG: hypothetical protein K2X82_23560, partial [Gemmataceae bacterium]|nr:hypothetical protein [Gemmataceae bacterium]
MVRPAVVVGFGALVAGLAAVPGRASLYQPDDPMAVPVRPDGTAEPLPFDEFKRRFVQLNNVADPRPGPDGKPNPDRARVLARIDARSKARDLPPDEAAALAADLIRAGRADDALTRLKPLYLDRDRRGTRTYAVAAALVHADAARGDWRHAQEYALDLADLPPPAPKGLTPAQRDWQVRLDRDYLPHYLRLRRDEAEAGRTAAEDEDPTPLFPAPDPGRPADPVRWVNDAGRYEPGTLAAAERAKLPPDALAVVQQLLLWFPSDTRLYWLLAELYAAGGDPVAARAILDECVWSRQYGNRRRLVEHRAALGPAADRAAGERARA